MEHNFDTGKTTQESPNAEDITIEFENQNGSVEGQLRYEGGQWVVKLKDVYAERYDEIELNFNLLRDAEEAVNIIKRSV